MKCYKLLKDLPTFKAGQLAYVSRLGNLMAGTPEEPETTSDRIKLMIYHANIIEKFPNILTEWFEEIQEEPTDSIHWKPKNGDEYWYTDGCAGIYRDRWDDEPIHFSRYSLGLIKRTKEECEKARGLRLAEVRLRRTSTFKPDFKNEHLDVWYIVNYNHTDKKLQTWGTRNDNSSEPVYYETREDAENSIKESRKDWLIYFGIEEEV